MLKRTLDKTIYYFGLVIIVFIPFQALAQNFLEKKFSPGLSFWLAHFYEPVVVLLVIVSIVFNLIPFKLSNWKRKIIPLLLLILGVLSVFVFAANLGRGLEGFRFDFIGLIFFFLYLLGNLTKGEKDKFISAYIVVALFAAAFALFERFLPLNYWTALGLQSFGWGNFSVVTVYQSSAYLPGPNQLASYLLPALFLLLLNTAGIFAPKSNNLIRYIAGAIVLAAIILTFSRAAFAGLIIGLLAYVIFVEKRWARKATYFLILFTLGLVLAYFYRFGSYQVKDLFTHGSSGSQHLTALTDSFAEIKNRLAEPVKLVFGSGIGDAGPAALKYGDGFVSESWYIQLVIELGIAGLLLWLYLVFAILVKLYRSKNYGLFLSLIAVSGAAIFLHTWADNPAVAITLLLLIGTTKEMSKSLPDGRQATI